MCTAKASGSIAVLKLVLVLHVYSEQDEVCKKQRKHARMLLCLPFFPSVHALLSIMAGGRLSANNSFFVLHYFLAC